MDQDAERNLGDACLKFNYSLSKMSTMGSTSFFFFFWSLLSSSSLLSSWLFSLLLLLLLSLSSPSSSLSTECHSSFSFYFRDLFLFFLIFKRSILCLNENGCITKPFYLCLCLVNPNTRTLSTHKPNLYFSYSFTLTRSFSLSLSYTYSHRLSLLTYNKFLDTLTSTHIKPHTHSRPCTHMHTPSLTNIGRV